jgi:hypothetical protein
MTKNTSTPARTLADWEINQYTKFLPYVPASENNGAEALPCVEIGGDENGDGAMQVYVYAENGGVHVSLHYDSAGPTEEDGSGPWAYYGPDRDLIPTVVTGGGDEPVYVAREGVPDLSDELVNDALAALTRHAAAGTSIGKSLSAGDACAELLARFLAISGRYPADAPAEEMPLILHNNVTGQSFPVRMDMTTGDLHPAPELPGETGQD